MSTHDLTRRQLLLAGTSALAVPTSVWAQAADWPQRPVRWVVGYPPGGITDVMARVVAQKVSATLGQQVVVENKPGASSNIAAQEVVKSVDGHTFLFAPTQVETSNPFLYKATFDPSKDLTPVSGVASSQLYLVARPTLAAKDAKELIELARRNPGKLTYASAGNATPPHLAGELFKQQANVFASHIPYKGAAPALQDVMAGQVDFFFDPGTALPHIRSGKVKLLGVASAKRSFFFADVPTLSEQGVRASELDIWFGLWAPNGLPTSVLTRLSSSVESALTDSEVRQKFASFAAEPAHLSSAAFKELLRRERATLGDLIKARRISAE